MEKTIFFFIYDEQTWTMQTNKKATFYSELPDLLHKWWWTIKKNENILSIKNLYNSAAFLEREVWDEFGIHFSNDFEIKRILTDYGFKGHPLKKDFPLTGFYECIFSFEKGRVKQKPISFLQEYRKFSYKNFCISTLRV